MNTNNIYNDPESIVTSPAINHPLKNLFKSTDILSGNKFSDEELRAFIEKNYGLEGLQRYKIAESLLNIFNLHKSKDVLLSIACTNPSKLILATAGSGKTTALQLDILTTKILDITTGRNKYLPVHLSNINIDFSKILYLNYNRYNKISVYNQHQLMVKLVNKYINPTINDVLDTMTVHSFCRTWLNAFKDVLEMPEIKINDEMSRIRLWNSIIAPRWIKTYGNVKEPVHSDILDSLYTFKEESLLDWNCFFKSSRFIASNLDAEFVKSCIEKYISLKKTLKVMDFVDLLKEFLNLIETNDNFRTKILDRYNLIVADELQDFTVLMNKVLLSLQQQGTRIMAVGDIDQIVYSFRGVSPDNILTLSKSLDNCELLSLDINYRCPSNIVNLATTILKLNTLRFSKKILSVKPDGIIEFKSYKTFNEEVNYLLDVLSNMSETDLDKTVIAYRNSESSLILAEELVYNKIPFQIAEELRPFSNELFLKIYNILTALYTLNNDESTKFLYMVLPISKAVWKNIICTNYKNRTHYVSDFKFDSIKGLTSNFYKVFNDLLSIANIMQTVPLSTYIAQIINYFKLYHFDFVYNKESLSQKEKEKNLLYLQRAFKFFNRNILFKNAVEQLSKICTSKKYGVVLSTIHSLKGLEFDNVFLMDLEDSLFPNYKQIEELYSEALDTALYEKEAENRLFYVLLTRAKRKLVLLYNEANPSFYIRLLNPLKNRTPIKNIPISALTDSEDSKFGSKLSFINRING